MDPNPDYWRRLVLCAALSALGAVAPNGAAAQQARIAVASNFKPVAEELARSFETDCDCTILLTAGSTGKLYAQIANGAPFDAFLAADAARPARLEAESRAVAGSRFTYALGALALWAPDGDATPDRLQRGTYRRLAMANPSLAPYGVAAMETLTALDAMARDKHRVLGESVGQAFAFVRTGNADLGFVALAQILMLPPSDRGAYWTPPAGAHRPIRQDAALLAHGRDNKTARGFLAYLRTEDARAMIEKSGYALP